MQNLTQIIRSALLGVLPMHLVNTIAPRIAEAIERSGIKVQRE